MKKNQLIKLAGNIGTSTLETYIIYLASNFLNQALREMTKNTSEELKQTYRVLKNQYF
jgi:hypothetical protein